MQNKFVEKISGNVRITRHPKKRRQNEIIFLESELGKDHLIQFFGPAGRPG